MRSFLFRHDDGRNKYHENISLFVYVDIIRTHYLTIEKVSTVSGHTTSLVCIIYVRMCVCTSTIFQWSISEWTLFMKSMQQTQESYVVHHDVYIWCCLVTGFKPTSLQYHIDCNIDNITEFKYQICTLRHNRKNDRRIGKTTSMGTVTHLLSFRSRQKNLVDVGFNGKWLIHKILSKYFHNAL